MSNYRNTMLKPTLTTINTPGAVNIDKVLFMGKKTTTISTATPLGPVVSEYFLQFYLGNTEAQKDVLWQFTSGNRDTEYTSLVGTTTGFAAGLHSKPFLVPGTSIINSKTGATITSPDGINMSNVTAVAKLNDSEGYKIVFTFNPLYARGTNFYWNFSTSSATNRDACFVELTTFIAALVTSGGGAGSGTSTTGITAYAGGGQGSAVALTTYENNVTTVATAGDSVKLLTAAPGLTQVVKNNGVSNLAVFPATSGTINGGSVNASITLVPGESRTFIGINTVDFESNKTVESINDFSTTNAITARAGGGQGSAVALTTAFNNVTVCATAGDSVILPTISAIGVGSLVVVENNGAADLAVFPITGSSINALGANASLTIPAGVRKYFIANTTTTWIAATKVGVSGGTVAAPAYTFDTQSDMGIYKISSTQLGFAVSGALTTLIGTGGILTDAVKARVEPGTVGAGTITASTNGNGRDFTTVLTLTNFVVGALAGAAAALGVGNKIYTFPAGAHLHKATYMSAGLTAVGTAKTPKIGIGSVIASGAVAVLNGTSTFMDYITEQTAANITGTATAKTAVATAGALTGISINEAASVKDVFLNAAATWSADNTGNLTATGTITLHWTKMS